jgi:hypothetical protein
MYGFVEPTPSWGWAGVWWTTLFVTLLLAAGVFGVFVARVVVARRVQRDAEARLQLAVRELFVEVEADRRRR